jgi:hypothetical protein
MVTVVDFDGCESTNQFVLSSLNEEVPDEIKIYPNPASTEIYIDLTKSNNQIEHLRIISVNGQVLIQSGKADLINVSALSEGVYILQIGLAGGKQIIKKVSVLR